MPTKASLDEYMGDIVKVRRSVHSSYGFMRIMAALSTFVYFPLFVSTAFVKDFVPHEFFMAYFLVLGMYVLVKIVKEAANKSFYLFDRREEDAGARRPEDPLSVRISFKIWPCNGIIKHIFSMRMKEGARGA